MNDASEVTWTTNPARVENKVDSGVSPGNHPKQARLSLWFVTHQNTEEWSEQKLNMLHKAMVILILFIYVFHIAANSYIPMITDETVLLIFNILEAVCLLLNMVCFTVMCCVNCNRAGTHMILFKNSRTWICVFWMLRSLVVEILKGQVLFGFVHMFHSILIYSTDAWYTCSQSVLITNLSIFLCVLMFQFFVTISPYGPSEPSWKFVDVNISANSLSRSNYFNLFVIYFDALIVAVFSARRGKFIMLTKKKKRPIIEISPSRHKAVSRSLMLMGFLGPFTLVIYAIDRSFEIISQQWIHDVIFAFLFVLFLFTYLILMWHSTSSKSWEILRYLSCQRRIIWVFILMGILFYLDNVYFPPKVSNFLFLAVIVMYISFDLVVVRFPRCLWLAITTAMIGILLFNTVRISFFVKECSEWKLKWGIFGEEISLCTVRRLIYQSILSLLFSAAIRTLRGRTDTLYFCNANIYRSTGTETLRRMDRTYIEKIAKQSSKQGP